ncbi:VWA domain-containing protein [Acetivibrio cellulolyticus]|uniref:VWA domain-containing protein n=1 Tax=Acetivibrio cellulolyticus TaxID=35830 RepID=UPI0001E2DF0A|nr:VWA domain-containing protein [Acetivibrio cellulolyticus]
MDFKMSNYYNPYLPVMSRKVDAIISIEAKEKEEALGLSDKQQIKEAIIFIIDTSGSMAGGKIENAIKTLHTCIDLLDDSCHFCILTFSESTTTIFPMEKSSIEAKEKAHILVADIKVYGGTKLSAPLNTASLVFAGYDDYLKIAYFVTDGNNSQSDINNLNLALKRNKGKFHLSCWGLGTDWNPKELKRIADNFAGTAEAITAPDEMASKFQKSLSELFSKSILKATLKLQVPKTIRINNIKQMSPEILDITEYLKTVDEKNYEISLGPWGQEIRDYHISFEVEPQEEGEEMLVCRPKISYITDNEEKTFDGQRVVITWTSRVDLSSKENEEVEHFKGQEELSITIRKGLDAKNMGDTEQATLLLGKAYKLANESGNDEATMRLKKVIEVLDESEGTVRLRSSGKLENKAADLELDLGGTRTVRRRIAE